VGNTGKSCLVNSQANCAIHQNKCLRYNNNNIYDICTSFRNDLNTLSFQNIQRLPGSPRQDGANSILSFYATLPSGGIIPKSILATVFIVQQDRILPLDSAIEDQKDSVESELLTPEQIRNAVAILLRNFPVAKVSKTRKYQKKFQR
jgi:hypothetical protein